MNQRDELLLRAARHASDYLAELGGRPVKATATGADLRRALAGPVTATGTPAVDVIDALAAAGRIGTVATQGPRYFGFVVGGSFPAATAADWLVSAWDQNCGIYVLSPLVSVVEEIAAASLGPRSRRPAGDLERRIRDRLPDGQLHGAGRGAPPRARRRGLGRRGTGDSSARLRSTSFVSDESHYTIFTALRLLGLGAERVQRVPDRWQGRMRADQLAARARRSGSGPCIVCAQAGNVNTGAFDPIEEIADAARARGAWLHVDGAFGLWAAASPSRGPWCTASSAQTRSPPTRTSGSTCRTTAASC